MALAVLAVPAILLVGLIVWASRRPRKPVTAADPAPPPRRCLSKMAALGFWFGLMAVGTLATAWILESLVAQASIFEIYPARFQEALAAARTIVAICALIPVGLSTLLSGLAILSVRRDREHGLYGRNLAILNLILCAAVLAGSFLA
jgi:heme/copper-type cytochrome/quinol oxidase subunit 1